MSVLVDCLRHRDSADGVATFLRTLRRDIEDGMPNPDDRAQLLEALDRLFEMLETHMTGLPG